MKFEKRSLTLFLLLIVSLCVAGDAVAGATGTQFQPLFTFFNELVLGFGGKAIAVAAVALGGIISVARVNPVPVLSGIAFAIFLQFTPGIIETILTATI